MGSTASPRHLRPFSSIRTSGAWFKTSANEWDHVTDGAGNEGAEQKTSVFSTQQRLKQQLSILLLLV